MSTEEQPVTVPEQTQQQQKPKKAPREKKAPKAPQVPSRQPTPIDSIDDGAFGDLPLNTSSVVTGRVFTNIKDLTPEKVGEKVWVRARAATIRGKGKTCFIQLRSQLFTCQLGMFAFGEEGQPAIELVKFAAKITPESIVDVYGTVVAAQQKVESCTQQDVEILVEKIFVVSAAAIGLPFQLSDASRHDPLDTGLDNEEKEEIDTPEDGNNKVIRVSQTVRLNNRFMDLRTPANQAIFKIQSRVCQYFRQFFIDRDFIEIHSPKIIPGVSEGGSQVFNVDYFGTQCCLAQSPQLYKQMTVVSDFHRVFEVGPVFRAEDSNTHRHMCEFIGLDFEMEIIEHYHEVLRTISDLFVYIFDQVNANCKAELAAVNTQYPFEPLKYNQNVLVITFDEANKLLVEAGEPHEPFADMSTPQEKKLGQIIKEKYDVDLYIVDKFPSAIRPFYTMPNKEDPRYSNSYDVFLRGEEITSGAQRIHDAALLRKRAAECEIPESSIRDYVRSFEYGAVAHGGGGIGLSRVTMLFLGLNNIRKSSLFPRVPNRCTP